MKTFFELRQELNEALSPAQKAAREKNRIGPKGEVGKREYGSDKAKRGFHKAQRGVSGKGDNRNTMSIFDRQPKTALQGNKPKGKLPEDTVNELDTSTLISYRKKANKQRFSSNKKTGQRTTGIDMANKKLRKRNIDKFGKHSPKGVDKMGNPKEDSDAVKAFLAKGGKIKKLPPAKAQGYHGKDDPGKDIKGMLDKPDTKKSVMGTRKKAKSMSQNEAMISTTSGPFGINPKVGLRVMKKGKEVPPTPPKIGVVSYTGGKKDEALIIRSKKPASKLRRDAESRPTGVREISKAKLGRYMKKVPADAAWAGDMMARPTPGAPGSAAIVDRGVKKFVKRTKGAAMAADKLTGKAKVPAK